MVLSRQKQKKGNSVEPAVDSEPATERPTLPPVYDVKSAKKDKDRRKRGQEEKKKKNSFANVDTRQEHRVQLAAKDAEHRATKTKLAEALAKIASLERSMEMMAQQKTIELEDVKERAISSTSANAKREREEAIMEVRTKAKERMIEAAKKQAEALRKRDADIENFKKAQKLETQKLRDEMEKMRRFTTNKDKEMSKLQEELDLLVRTNDKHDNEARVRAAQWLDKLQADGHCDEAIQTLKDIVKDQVWNTEVEQHGLDDSKKGRRKESIRAEEIRNALYASALSATVKAGVEAAMKKKKEAHVHRLQKKQALIEAADWKCPVCYSLNKNHMIECSACGRSRNLKPIRSISKARGWDDL